MMSSILAESEGKYNQGIKTSAKKAPKRSTDKFVGAKDPEGNKTNHNHNTSRIDLIEKISAVWCDDNEFM